MKLRLERRWLYSGSTVGELFVDDAPQRQCFTLEDTVRIGPKIPGRTAIPFGSYEIVLNWSQRFKRTMPLILNVPKFTGVRIHPGNTAEDTAGCVLVGEHRGGERILNSVRAYDALMSRFLTVPPGETIQLEITRDLRIGPRA